MSEPMSPEALLIPVGAAMGRFWDDGEPDRFRVRLGFTFHDLTSAEYAVWTEAAQSRPERSTRDSLIRAAGRAGVSGPEGCVQRLEDSGLLHHVEPGTPESIQFANAYRLVPLLPFDTSENPARGVTALAHPTRSADAVVPEFIADLYRYAGLDVSLASAVQASAQIGAQAGLDDADLTDPMRLLGVVLASIHRLLGPQLACLDRVAQEDAGE